MRPPVVRAYLGDEVIADNFAGGGGASLGIEMALGRSPDLAVNHDPEAIAMHAANHPTTTHHIESVWKVDPRVACAGRRVALAWFSPDCKHHSKAKGGKPREQKIRGLAWVAVSWAQRVRPRVIALENVEEFQDWGPLHRVGEQAGQPIRERRGETFRAFVRKLERLGYVVEWRLLRASDYGAPTSRRRLFLVARCDGVAVRWPRATHGRVSQLLPERTAAECIDWRVPVTSIFERNDRPLADKTLARIARGLRKFVLESDAPYVVRDESGRPFIPYLIHRSNGERVGQAPRIYDIRRPLGTIMAQGVKHSLCVAWLAKHFGDRPTGGWGGGAALAAPLSTITVRDHHALVAAFLIRYNGTSTGQPVDRPLSTIDTRDRFGLVLVQIDGETYSVSDIAMRDLVSRELFLAQGFPKDYVLNPQGPRGRCLSDTAQKRMCGNSVSPPLAAAVVRAQFCEDA